MNPIKKALCFGKRGMKKVAGVCKRKVKKVRDGIQRRADDRNSLTVSMRTDEFFMQQNRVDGFNRLDTVVRYLAIENYYGKNDDGFALYRKMQSRRQAAAKHNTDDYVEKFKALIASWEKNGYRADSRIRCDSNLHLMDGSHRLAMAMYHREPTVNFEVRPRPKEIRYGVKWFLENDFTLDEIARIEQKCDELLAWARKPVSCILWAPVAPYFDEITEKLRKLYPTLTYADYDFADVTYERAVKGIYAVDDIAGWKINKKIGYMNAYQPKRIRVLQLPFDCPDFRLKASTHGTLSKEGESVKVIFRNCYKGKLESYFHDIIIHTGDNYTQSEFIDALFLPAFKLDAVLARLTSFPWALAKSQNDYYPADFPKSYPFSKDLDLLCRREDAPAILAAIEDELGRELPERCAVRSIVEDGGTRIRVEQQDFLIFQFDVRFAEEGLTEDYIRGCIERREACGGYARLADADEVYFRLLECCKAPSKQRHFDYVREHRALLDPEKAKQLITHERLSAALTEIDGGEHA